jgi:hypothetical protein
MMMMFVVTPSLDSIEHKFNSKSIKYPKLHKVPTLEAINNNKPWSEWKERLRNFGVKPPKRRIELGWMTRRTRLKKPSSSRSFAREACGAQGARGSWGLKTENRTFFSSLFQQATTKKNKKKTKKKTIHFFSSVHATSARTQPIRADASARLHRASEGVRGGSRARARGKEVRT